jgi:biopolymer transport protein TolR
MGVSVKSGGGGGRRRRGRHAPMSEINVTPMVDVMLVLLIIFMVAAPLLQGGIPVDLPQAKGQQLPQPKGPPLEVTVKANGEVAIGETIMKLDDVVPKLKAITKNGTDDTIYFRADGLAAYGAVAKVMGRLKDAGFTKFLLVTQPEEGR